MASRSRVAIIGAGFGGIGASIALARGGETDQVLLDRHDDVGGTWTANRYPGCRCDVDSNLYSFSFAPNPDWSNTYSYQDEIQAYLRKVADDFGVTPRCRLGTEVTRAAWHDDELAWHLDLRDVATGATSTHVAEVVVSANGLLSEPNVPDFAGLDDFAGEVLHSARWRPEVDLAGKRVAVIGTGASAVQIVPRVAPLASHLTVFQRTPAWVLPHTGHPVSERRKRLYRRVPALQRALRTLSYTQRERVVLPALLESKRLKAIEKLATRHLAAQVPDPVLRAKLTPTFAPGCKRLTPSNEYLPAIAAPTTTLVTEGIERFSPSGIVTRDGVEHPFDVVILATGFRVTSGHFPFSVVGRDGRSMGEAWAATSMSAYLGTTVAGFPNWFMLAGPNTGIGHTSLVLMLEAQIAYVADALATMRADDVAAVEVRPDVVVAFNEALQRKFARSVWTTGGCSSWYLDARGNNTTLWPDTTASFVRQLARFDVSSYYQRQRPRPVEVAA